MILVLPQFYVFHFNQVIRMPINAGVLILVNDKIRMFAEEPLRKEYSKIKICKKLARY